MLWLEMPNISGGVSNFAPLYNFIDDSYFAKMHALRHL